MAHQALISARSLFAIALLVAGAACGSAPVAAPSPVTNAPTTNRAENTDDPESWTAIHSSRFAMSLPLPDTKHWVVDDKSRPELVAVHAPTRSMLVAESFFDPELVNRARCEERARDRGLVPGALRDARTIEDEATTTADAFDSRIWVAMRPGKKDGELVGDVFVFGAHIRKCIFVHYATIVASEQDAELLSDRLAAARLHIAKDLKVDALEAVARDPRR